MSRRRAGDRVPRRRGYGTTSFTVLCASVAWGGLTRMLGLPACEIEHRAVGEWGTGLGLSIACQLVRAHGGELSVQSAPGRGTSLRVELPAA